MNWRNDEKTLDRLAQGERHFNTLQGGIRALASTWTLAAIGGISVLLRQDTSVTWLVSPFVIATLVCAMGSLGLAVLWVVDNLVYHRLLNSIFLVGLRLEYEHRDIPPVRAMMAYSAHPKGGMSYWLRFFYTAPAAALSLIAISICLIFSDAAAMGSEAAMLARTVPHWICWPLAILSVLAVLLMEVLSRRVPFRARANAFNDDEFTEMVDKGDFAALLNRSSLRQP